MLFSRQAMLKVQICFSVFLTHTKKSYDPITFLDVIERANKPSHATVPLSPECTAHSYFLSCPALVSKNGILFTFCKTQQTKRSRFVNQLKKNRLSRFSLLRYNSSVFDLFVVYAFKDFHIHFFLLAH